MSRKITLLHTVASNAAAIGPMVGEHVAPLLRIPAGELEVRHMVDENLLQDTIDHGLLPRTFRRVAQLVGFAEESDAEAVLVTCSSVGAAVTAAGPMVGIPVLRIDEPMAHQAVTVAAAGGGRIGIAATLGSTLEPTADLIDSIASTAGVTVRVEAEVAAGAFAALRSGDPARHDVLVANLIHALAEHSDVVVLAQASMARVLDGSAGSPVPVLTSTISGVRQLAAALAARSGRAAPQSRP